MEPGGRQLLRLREETPRHDYFGCINKIKQMIEKLEAETGQQGSVGIGIPGSLEPVSRLGKGASSTWLLGKPVEKDLHDIIQRPLRVENNTDCFAASEAVDGAGKGFNVVFAVILGSGAGAGNCGWRKGTSWPERRRRMGPQSSALPQHIRNTRKSLLLRPPWLHGNLGVRPRL